MERVSLAALCTATSLLCVFSFEVTVKSSDLKLCENHKRSCVTDCTDCDPRPPASIQKTLNVSCYYYRKDKTLTCEWSEESDSHAEPEVSVIISRKMRIMSCPALLNPSAMAFNVTARIKNFMMESEIWTQPHTVTLKTAGRTVQPVLTALSSTEDSVVVSWSCDTNCVCQLRYKVDNTHTWTEAPDVESEPPTVTHSLTELEPLTVYRAAVRCRERSDMWSEWSADVTASTLERAPSRPPDVCYRVERRDSAGSVLLHLMWKELDLHEAGGRVLGYQVSYEPTRKQPLRDAVVQNVTETTALLLVEAGNCSVAVAAFNGAGCGPAARLGVDTHGQQTLSSARHLWASSSSTGLLVQWEPPADPAPSVPSVSYYAVQWRSETRPSPGRSTTVDGVSTSALLPDVDPEESYLITVFPVYEQQCGLPQSLPASLQQGALSEAVKLRVADVTKTTVTVVWEWQRTSGPIRVDAYSAVLRTESETHTVSLWPDQRQHSFLNLQPNTDYSLLLLADGAPRSISTVTTDFDKVPVVATATPLMLLAVTVLIISILTRTVYKSYFFPPISSPRGSSTGQWLMDPNLQKHAERNILHIDDFLVTDLLGQKSFIAVTPNREPSAEEGLHDDAPLMSISQLFIKMDPEYVSDAPVFTEPLLASLHTSYHPVYTVSCTSTDPDPDQDQDQDQDEDQDQDVFISEENHEADVARPANSCFPQEEEEESRRVFETSHHGETPVKCSLRELVANTSGVRAHQTSCRAPCAVNSSPFQGNRDVETKCPALICDNDYIANSCFTAKTTEEE